MRYLALLSVFALAFVIKPVFAQQGGHSHKADGTHSATQVQTLPQEPGQGAFAAIAEIVRLLAENPETNWADVDIDALREHLKDMDLLVSDTDIRSAPIAGGLELRIRTIGEAGEAASRMVPAHAPMLEAETGWSSRLTPTDGTLIWRVTADHAEARIRALGFFGLMAIGDHHRAHHLAIASGDRGQGH